MADTMWAAEQTNSDSLSPDFFCILLQCALWMHRELIPIGQVVVMEGYFGLCWA